MTQFSIGQAVRISYQSAQRDWKVWLLTTLLLTLASLPQAITDIKIYPDFSTLGTMWLIIGGLFIFLLLPGIQQNSLLAARGEASTARNLAGYIKFTGKFLLFYILYSLIVGLGFILLIIPGLYFMVRYGLTPYILLDNPKMGVLEAMTESTRMTKGKTLKLIGSLFLLGILSAIVFLGISAIYNVFSDPYSSIASLITLNAILLIPGILVNALTFIGPASIYNQIKSSVSVTK